MALQMPALDADTPLRRALLRAGEANAEPQDLIDCAELCLHGGRRDLAAELYGAAGLGLGFTGAFLQHLRRVNDRERLWSALPSADDQANGGFSVDLAIEDLRRLMPLCGALPPPGDLGQARLAAHADRDFARSALVARATDVLREIVPAVAEARFAGLVRGLSADLAILTPLRIEAYVGLDVAALAGIVATERLRIFAAHSQPLLHVASADVLREVAQLRTDAMGPFFNNVPRLIRDVRDIFGLIDAAAGGRADPDIMTTWVVLLSAHLSAEQLAALTSELGDRAMVTALDHILLMIDRLGDAVEHYPVAMSIRDSCLDVDAFDVAEKAQSLIVEWRPLDAHEWRRLGEIRGLRGDDEGAGAALDRAVALNPSDPIIDARLGERNAGKPITSENMVSSRRALRQMRLAAFQLRS
jgi:tetratricopeptide (TPR) repeat protein